MTFTIVFRPKAAKSLRRLHRSIGALFAESLKDLERSPEIGEQLIPSQFWKIRVGDCRVIHEIDMPSNRVIVLFLGHRKNVYDEFSRLL